MSAAELEGQGVVALVVQLIPIVLAAAAVLVGRPAAGERAGTTRSTPWRRAEGAAAAVFGLALVATGLELGPALGLLSAPIGLDPAGAAEAGPVTAWLERLGGMVRVDALSLTMLLLVTSIGWVIVRYSHRYLDGDSGSRRSARWLQATLAAVTQLVITDHLLLLALAWIATSLALHQLLTHFADRPAAQIAAHKKFIASRVAEVGVLCAIGLIARSVGSFSIADLFAQLESEAVIDPRLELAGFLLAFAAALKCAQMPFHGWLIQVMEAPTPVSALLHAGVVNIGGFLMIRLAPLLAEAEGAQLLLIAWGSANAVIASLVMATRVSIKVALAWSTCAQMGFMLLECGLGAWSLALLHLVAHSLYKAHAFLVAGSVVEQSRVQALLPPKGPVPLVKWFAAVPLVALATLPVALLFGLDPRREPALIALGPIFVVALVPFAVRGLSRGAGGLGFALAGCAALAALYGLGHLAFGALLAQPATPLAGSRAGIVIALSAFGLLFAVQGILSARPDGALARALYPPLFAGLYLDDLFTRLTFRVWPARMPGALRDRSVGTNTR